MDSDIGVFAIVLGALSSPTRMHADGQANLDALHDEQERLTYSPCFVTSATHSLA